MLKKPVTIYDNWSAYDELSDNIVLTEELAMRQLFELLRLRSAGVHFDYYLMDAFWYAPASGYRAWRQPHWPNGPDRWLDSCLSNGIKPGLWIAGNTLSKLEAVPAWTDSLDAEGGRMCLFHGGYLPNLLETLRYWYERGVRAFKWDFLQLKAATASIQQSLLPSEIRARNVSALRDGLIALRRDCPEVLLLGYNGLEEADTMSGTDLPLRKTVDTRWLEAFDTLYCGDPRPGDVPCMNFWRSMDIYSDHMVRVYEKNGFPLERIDNCGFMIGVAGTCYSRRTHAWQGALLLSLARGGLVNIYHGNLELLDDEQARWFAKAQSLFRALRTDGEFATFGGMPGESQPYGFLARDAKGTILTLMNPAQSENTVELPGVSGGRLLFYDVGYTPRLDGQHLTLGTGQMAVIGAGRYASPDFDLGQQADVVIPASVQPYPAQVQPVSGREVTITAAAPASGSLRIVVRQKDKKGRAKRSTGGAPPNGTKLDKIIAITAQQNGLPVDVIINYDKAIWSGLSWAVGEIPHDRITPGAPMTIRCATTEPGDVTLAVELYRVEYGS